MPEPLDTIQRVTNGKPLAVADLQAALGVLDAHSYEDRADVLEARRRVLDDLQRLGVDPAPTGEYAAIRRLRSGAVVPAAELLDMEQLFVGHLAAHGGAEDVKDALQEVRRVIDRTGARAAVGALPPGVDRATSSGTVSSGRGRRSSGGSSGRTVGGGALGGLVAALVVIGAVGYGCSRTGSGPNAGDGAGRSSAGAPRSAEATGASVAAWDACIQAVAGRLEAPSGAAFESIVDGRFSTIGGTVQVSGSVLTQNGAGAEIRAHWVCTTDVSTGGQASNVRVLSIG